MARALRAIQTTLVCCGTCDEKTRCFISTLQEADGRPPTPSLKRANGYGCPVWADSCHDLEARTAVIRRYSRASFSARRRTQKLKCRPGQSSATGDVRVRSYSDIRT